MLVLGELLKGRSNTTSGFVDCEWSLFCAHATCDFTSVFTKFFFFTFFFGIFEQKRDHSQSSGFKLQKQVNVVRWGEGGGAGAMGGTFSRGW